MITSKDNRFMNIARNLAMLSTYKKYPVGCVVTYKSKVISTGYNMDKTSPLQKRYNIERYIHDNTPHKIHAEMHALKHIIDLDIDWNKVSVYIYRKRKDREYGLARPCKACMSLIRDIGIQHIFYTTNYNYYTYENIV